MKSPSSLYKPIYTILGCELYGLHELATQNDCPRFNYTYMHTYMSVQWWAVWANKSTDSTNTTCRHVRQVCVIFYSLSKHTWFQGMSYAIQMGQLLIGLACAKVRLRRRWKGCIAIDLTYKGGRLPIRPSTSFPIARSVYFPIIDVFGPVSVLDNIPCFHVAWGLLTMRWYIVSCRFHTPDQRETTAMPCSSVLRGEYTLTLGQV